MLLVALSLGIQPTPEGNDASLRPVGGTVSFRRFENFVNEHGQRNSDFVFVSQVNDVAQVLVVQSELTATRKVFSEDALWHRQLKGIADKFRVKPQALANSAASLQTAS